MSDRSKKRIRITEAELAILMRQAQKTPSEFNRPDDFIIAKYLLCEASEFEKAVIEKAMLNSAEFRREILILAKDVDSLAEDARSSSEKAAPIPIPDRQSFLEKFTVRKSRTGFRENLTGLLKRLLIPQVYLPAAATAATIFIVFLASTEQFPDRYVADNIEWHLEETGLQNSLLRLKHPRAASRPAISEANAEARTAALSEMRELLTYADGIFELNPPAEVQKPSSNFHQYVLQISDSASKYSKSFSTFVPSATGSVDNSLAVWLLTLPSRNLHQVDLQSDTLLIAWPSATDNYGCLVVTYRDQDGYRALKGHTVDLRN